MIKYNHKKHTDPDMLKRANQFYDEIKHRRTIREFSNGTVPLEIIKRCILAAGTAPSGANKQPWHFAVVQTPEIKKQIRDACEKVEYEFYHGAAGDEWLDDLKDLGTDVRKPFLEEAPFLIVVFAEKYGLDAAGKKTKNYYVNESVGISTGILITALHHAGLNSLTYTPMRMGFLRDILNRPKNERPVMILVAGYAADNLRLPDIERKAPEFLISYY